MTEALHFEGIKYSYRQNKDGVVVSFVVHPNDIPSSLATSHIGARYIVALVEIGNDEQPKLGKEAMPNNVSSQRNNAPPRQSESLRTAGAKPYRDKPPAQQAGLRCNDAVFAAFLKEKYEDDWHESGFNAAECVRLICGVISRSELGTNQRARVIWHQLDEQFKGWAALERAS